MRDSRSCKSWLVLLTAAVFYCTVAPLASAASTCDNYNTSTGILSIGKVVVGNLVYTDVTVRIALADVRAVGPTTALPPSTADIYDVFDATSGLLTIACVTVNGTNYSNVVTGIGAVVGFTGYYPLPTAVPVVTLLPLPNATVGTAYSSAAVIRNPQYTYSIDTLANGSPPPGMTLDLNGVLKGNSIATGATDINGNQVAKTYNFGVCATDTLTRVTTSPCSQTTITLDPALPNLAGNWSGSWNRTNVGDGGCTYNDSGTLTFKLTQTGTSVTGSVSATGIQLRYIETCSFAMNTSSQGSVTGTASNSGISLQYSLPIAETGGTNTYSWSVTLTGTTTLKGTIVSSKGATGSFTLTKQ